MLSLCAHTMITLHSSAKIITPHKLLYSTAKLLWVWFSACRDQKRDNTELLTNKDPSKKNCSPLINDICFVISLVTYRSTIIGTWKEIMGTGRGPNSVKKNFFPENCACAILSWNQAQECWEPFMSCEEIFRMLNFHMGSKNNLKACRSGH